MKAMLLRVGIDKGTDGVLAPIFEDGSFEYIPLSENDGKSKENRTYNNTIGRSGKPFSTYLPKRIENKVIHFDPEFLTYTYGDPTTKRNYLVKLEEGDFLVFYAGLTPYKNDNYKEALYIIGYFIVENVINFNRLSKKTIEDCYTRYSENAHLKRKDDTKNLIIVVGDNKKSKLLKKGILISERKPDKKGRPYHTVSKKMENLLGISGSIQRSLPIRFIEEENHIINLKRILGIT